MKINRGKLAAQRARSLAALSVPDLPPEIRALYKGAADKAEVLLELDAAQQRLDQERKPPAAPAPSSVPRVFRRASTVPGRGHDLAHKVTPSNGAKFKMAERIRRRNMLADFGAYIERHAQDAEDVGAIFDQSRLPHPKNDLLSAICLELIQGTDSKTRDWLLIALIILADFQPEVGAEPLLPLGMNLTSSMNMAEKLRLLKSPDISRNAARWAEFSKLVEADRDAMQSQAKTAIEIGCLMSIDIKRELFGT